MDYKKEYRLANERGTCCVSGGLKKRSKTAVGFAMDARKPIFANIEMSEGMVVASTLVPKGRHAVATGANPWFERSKRTRSPEG